MPELTRAQFIEKLHDLQIHPSRRTNMLQMILEHDAALRERLASLEKAKQLSDQALREANRRTDEHWHELVNTQQRLVAVERQLEIEVDIKLLQQDQLAQQAARIKKLEQR